MRLLFWIGVFGSAVLGAAAARAEELHEHTERALAAASVAQHDLEDKERDKGQAEKEWRALLGKLGVAKKPPAECVALLLDSGSEAEVSKCAAAIEKRSQEYVEVINAATAPGQNAPKLPDEVQAFCEGLTTTACKTNLEEAAKEVAPRLTAASAKLAAATAAVATAATRERRTRRDATFAQRMVERATSPSQSHSLDDRLYTARVLRCVTAICWGGDGTQYGIEPILDLPVSMFWALGNGGLANYINANHFQVSVSAGVRYWFANDIMSLGLILAQPNLTDASPIRFDFSDKDFPKSAIARPFPTLALGVWGDVFMFTLSYDQLRNTNGSAVVDSRYRFDEVLSRTFTLGVSLNTATAARNAAGAAIPVNKKGQGQ